MRLDEGEVISADVGQPWTVVVDHIVRSVRWSYHLQSKVT